MHINVWCGRMTSVLQYSSVMILLVSVITWTTSTQSHLHDKNQSPLDANRTQPPSDQRLLELLLHDVKSRRFTWLLLRLFLNHQHKLGSISWNAKDSLMITTKFLEYLIESITFDPLAWTLKNRLLCLWLTDNLEQTYPFSLDHPVYSTEEKTFNRTKPKSCSKETEVWSPWRKDIETTGGLLKYVHL